jgi:hypothetical protein
MQKLVALSITTVLWGFFNNCSEVEFSEGVSVQKNLDQNNVIDDDVENEDPDPDPDVDFVKTNCKTGVIKRSLASINFEKPKYTCEWGVNGNLEKKNGYFQARIEQSSQINLPKGAIICDAEFKFQKQSMRYDDHFILTMNNILLASSYDFTGVFSKDKFLYNYDWSKMAGMYWDNSKELYGLDSYCVGRDEWKSSCNWPQTDTNGEIDLQFPFEVIQNISAKNINSSSTSLKFITIGDNDEWDCEHSDIQFSIEIDYVISK